MGGGALKTYCCKRTNEAIVIDGDISKPAWENMESVSLVDTVTGDLPKQRTMCKMMWDDNFLYVSFLCEDDSINAVMTNFNDLIYNEEVVEIFIDDNCDLKTYIELEVNPLNTLLHYSMHNDLKGNKIAFARIEQKIITAVQDNREERTWSVEMAIPFSEFITAPNIPPMAGDKWLMNLYRIDRPTDSKDEYTAWNPTVKINFHMPEKFGKLVFVE